MALSIIVFQSLSPCLLLCFSLVVVSNEIRGKGLCALAECMSLNTTLSNIYLWGNEHEESACLVSQQTTVSINMFIYTFTYPFAESVVGVLLQSRMFFKQCFSIPLELSSPPGSLELGHVHSWMLSTQLFFCLPRLYPSFAVTCRIVLKMPVDLMT